MSRGVNKVIIVGRLGQDPDTKTSKNGKPMTFINVATSESWNTDQGKQEKTTWHKVIFFNRLAEIAAEYLQKGSEVYVEGRIETRKWQAEDGTDRWATEIIANEMQMLGSKPSGNSTQQTASQYDADDIPF